MQFINTLSDDMNLTEFYLCQEKQSLVTKNGKPYLKLSLADKTGSVTAMVWNLDGNIGPFDKNDIVKIRGVVGSYQGDRQINITQLRRALESEYDASNYYRVSDVPPDALYARIRALAESCGNLYLRQLLDAFFPVFGAQKELFSAHPAAEGFHHNYRGGLAEHTLSVATIAQALQAQYPIADRDLVIAGALLHDVGKLTELTDAPACEYSDAGRLIGHISLGAMKLSEACAKIEGFPAELRDRLMHIILSHHGSLEFGSPVLPATPEALIVHLADDADAKLKEMKDGIELDREEGSWTAYNKALQRYLYKPEISHE